MKKNNNKIMFNKIEKNGRPSKVNDELIRLDLPSNNHDDGANNYNKRENQRYVIALGNHNEYV